MVMKRCPMCGENYSETYCDCPFCEEEEALREGEEIRRNVRMGKRVAYDNQRFSPITPTLIVLILIMLTYEYLVYYSCITIGQTAKKNRIIMSFLAYFVYYIITQVFGTIFAIAGMIFSEAGAIIRLMEVICNHPYTSAHIIFATLIAFFTVLCVVFYFVNRHIMNRKLNLE